MISHEERLSLLELLFRETGMNLPDLEAEPQVFEDLIQDVFEDLQRSKVRLREQISALQARNKDLEEYVLNVAHDLKEPLAVLAITSYLITNIPDLNSQKIEEYVQQMGLTAQEMKKIINNLLLFARVDRVEAPVEPTNMERVVDRFGLSQQCPQAWRVSPES